MFLFQGIMEDTDFCRGSASLSRQKNILRKDVGYEKRKN